MVSLLMDDPALRKFLGIAGHASNISCPKCIHPTRVGNNQNFCWPDVSASVLRDMARDNAHYRQGLSIKFDQEILS
jgi:hypothetical protein